MSTWQPEPQQNHPYPSPQPQPTPPPPKKQKRFGILILIITAMGSWLIGLLMGIGGDTATTEPVATVTVTAAPADTPAAKTTTQAAPKPAPEPTKKAAPTIGDGTYLVGSEIARGQWKSSGEEGGLCYADTQTKSGTIRSQEVSSGEPVVIRIGGSAYTFKSSGCGTWKKVG